MMQTLKTIAKVVNALKVKGITKIDCFVVPHHGSAYHDIEPILSLKPTHAVVAVNPANKYGHPAAPILRTLIEKLGPQNVFFTGAEGNLEFGPKGPTEVTFSAALRDSYERFVLPNRLRDAHKGITKNEEDYKYIQSVMLQDPGAPPPSPSPNIAPKSPPQGGMPGVALQTKIDETGSLLSPEFEVSAVSKGGTTPDASKSRKIFTPSPSVEEKPIYVPIVANFTATETPEVRAEVARGVLDRLNLLSPGKTPQRWRVAFETEAGFPNGIEPSREVTTASLRAAAYKVERSWSPAVRWNGGFIGW